MARPNKFNLQYFPLDVDFFDDHKVISIEEAAQLKGGYIALRLMAMVYADKGYYLEWPEKFEFTAAKRIGNGVTGALVGEIFKLCLKHELFNKEIFSKHNVVTSAGIQRRWVKVMNDMRRKVIINADYWLVSSEETGISSEETCLPGAESTQKEMKPNEIKSEETKGEKNTSPAKPAPPVEETEPFWKLLVAVWFDFGKEKFGEEPSFKGQDPKIFKKIIHLLKKRAESKNTEWTAVTGPQRLRFFLEAAFQDAWLGKHFLLANLEKQFDQIIQHQNNAAPKKAPPGATVDIEYLYSRHLEGKLLWKLVTPEHYDLLFEKKLFVIGPTTIEKRTKQLFGTNKTKELELIKDYQNGFSTTLTDEDLPELKKAAVFEFFDQLKLEGRVSIEQA